MKKSLVLTGLLLGSTVAMADFYVGVDYGVNSNTDKADVSGYGNASQKNKYSDFSIKLGAGRDGGVKSQLRLSKISYDKTIFDNSNKSLTEFGADFIKEFKIESIQNFYPFIKLGLGVGSMSVEGYTESSILEVSFNAGAGISYKAIDHLYLIAGIDYVGRKWQDIEYVGTTVTVSTTGSGVKPYIGVNYAF